MKRRATMLCALPLLAALSALAAAETCAIPAGTSFPTVTWEQLDLAASGWSAPGLAEAGRLADEAGYTALVVSQGGRLVYASGEPAEPENVRSIRKSLLNAVIGQLVDQGKISLDWTLEQIGIDDVPPLTPDERKARIRDLLMSRSGIYHEAAYAANSRGRPERGSYAPGAHFYYNNWDFNALGSIVHGAAGQSLFEAFDARIAKPLAMQDFSVAEGTEYRYEDGSQHPAYLFWMSARDLARFGLLYLREGCWNGEQLLPVQWVRDSIYPHSDANGLDYGYLWWSQGPVKSRGLTQRIFFAEGNGAQTVWVIPELDLVIATTTDTSNLWFWRQFGMVPDDEDAVALLYAVLDARPNAPKPVTPQ